MFKQREATMRRYWPYYTLRDGKLYDERGRQCFKNQIFTDVAEPDSVVDTTTTSSSVGGTGRRYGGAP
jgi:hypothetical protein